MLVYSWISETFLVGGDLAIIAEQDLKASGFPYFKTHFPVKIDGDIASYCYFHGMYTDTWANPSHEGTLKVCKGSPTELFNVGFDYVFTISEI